MILLLMGTTGAGKTTVGKLVASQLGWTFLDADTFHSPANIEKMRCGIPLTDEDRAAWLAAIHAELARKSAAGGNVVLACSALKQRYRNEIGDGLEMRVVYLKGNYETMAHHIALRHGHFAGEGILAGQFADLEEPRDALVMDVSRTPEEIASEIVGKFARG
ncbi:MAG TPA: gluconokinase, GntK/IdnK-type [Candidatus Acidoferrum sp.]|nr:gluconokinase, GntK/IdnK-type [Candidatus Acidoferrum sp.]